MKGKWELWYPQREWRREYGDDVEGIVSSDWRRGTWLDQGDLDYTWDFQVVRHTGEATVDILAEGDDYATSRGAMQAATRAVTALRGAK